MNAFKSAKAAILLAVFLASPIMAATAPKSSDPYLWLEDVSGKRALDWVRSINESSKKELESSPEFEPLRKRILAILNSKDRIPHVYKAGKYYYNFWRDEKYVRGLWRRTSLEEYKKASPAWETVLDLDKLAADEKENWTWSSEQILKPDYDLCLIELSRGGADATVVREFDLTKKEFVKNGFNLPEAKSNISWRNRDSVYVGTDFGKGSMTSSGYPRIVKEWKRGTPLSEAKIVFEGKTTDVSVAGYLSHDHGRIYEFVYRSPSTYTNEMMLKRGHDWVKIEKPEDAGFGTYIDDALMTLRKDWTVNGKTYKAGSLLTENLDAYLKGERNFEIVFEPTERKSLESSAATKNYFLLTELDNVRQHPYMLHRENGKWTRTAVEAPEFGSVSMEPIDPDESDDYFMESEDFLTPSTLFLGTCGKPEREKLKSMPSYFNSDGLEVKQFEAKSKDGTLVPYFQINRKNMKLDGTNPTLLYGYGGFEVSLLPYYDSQIGAAWLERGGVYVLANIRGGNEFGPKWHDGAKKENRQNAYDDFEAIAEDLAARKVTSAKHLGIDGASNGGLLMGVMLTQRPELFGAIHCGSPLLDMQRYSHLLARASWMEEYGDPDKAEDWAFISKYSPYQNVSKDKQYPPILITTSTRDDRVHPGHARKMAARLKEQGHEVLYYENIEGGHGAAANKEQKAYMDAIAYTFLWNRLK